MAAASVVLIVPEDEVQVVKSEPGFETDIRVFADTDAIKAQQLITRDRPRLVVLGRAFTESKRGAALIHAISTDPTLADTQIRVLGQTSDYLHLVSRRAKAGLAPGTAVPGEPLPPDYLGRRQARRFRMDAAMRVRLGGTSITLVDLSRTGAYVVGPIVLRPNQRVQLRGQPVEGGLGGDRASHGVPRRGPVDHHLTGASDHRPARACTPWAVLGSV